MSVLLILGIFVLLVVIFGQLLRRFAVGKLSVERAFSKKAVFEGETGEMVEVVSNNSWMIVPWLRIESRVSPHLVFGSQDNLDMIGRMYHKSIFTLMPYQRTKRRHHIRFAHRGEYNVGNASITAGDFVGIFQSCIEQNQDVGILVYPRLLDDGELPAPFSRLIGDCIVSRQLLRDPFMVSGIRPYQMGDNVRDIHWPATARTGEAQVRVHDFTAQTRLLVLVNMQLTEKQWGELMEYEQGPVEHAISLAATLCVRALRAGLPAGFGANMPIGAAKEPALLLPAGGAAREEELLSAFARMRVQRACSFDAYRDGLRNLSGLDIVILSCYESEQMRRRINALRLAGNTVQVYQVERGKSQYDDLYE